MEKGWASAGEREMGAAAGERTGAWAAAAAGEKARAWAAAAAEKKKRESVHRARAEQKIWVETSVSNTPKILRFQ